MRWQFKVLIVVAAGFAILEMAQSRAQVPGGGAPFGAKNQQNPLALLQMKAVKDEIKLTPDQAKKVDEAVWKSLGTVLDAEQLKRLKQIDLQQKDFRAFADPAIQDALKMTAEQKTNVQTIMDDADKEIMDLAKDTGGVGKGKGGGFDFTKIQTIQKETKDRVFQVLDKTQKRTWNEMIGEKFDFPTQGKGKKGGQD
jgi:hypothetical protein